MEDAEAVRSAMAEYGTEWLRTLAIVIHGTFTIGLAQLELSHVLRSDWDMLPFRALAVFFYASSVALVFIVEDVFITEELCGGEEARRIKLYRTYCKADAKILQMALAATRNGTVGCWTPEFQLAFRKAREYYKLEIGLKEPLLENKWLIRMVHGYFTSC